MRKTLIILGTLLVLILLILGACAPTPGHVYTDGVEECGGDGEPIVLVNNPDATNPTYAELVAFIRADTTDTKLYAGKGLGGLTTDEDYEAYVCADFAEDVHNSAEAAGIRAAWVSIDFEGDDEGHACNAFEITDRGLVYIDCTGGNPRFQLTPGSYIMLYSHAPPSKPTSWDTVAYVEIGKEYGLIDIAKAKSLSYSFYEKYTQKWQEYEVKLEAYNREVERYNGEISINVYYEGSPELARMEAWKTKLIAEGQELDKLAEELGEYYFAPLGIVKDINIHW